MMQHQKLRKQGLDLDDDDLLTRRKHLTYRLMNERMAALGDGRVSDETLYGIISAGVAESRVSNVATARKHLDAGLTLWEMRSRCGGPQPQVTYPVGLVMCNAYIGIGVDNFFKLYVSFLTAASSIVDRLKSMQTWNHEVRQCVSDGKTRPTVATLPSDNLLAARAIIVAGDSVIRGHVRRWLAAKSAPVNRTALGALFAINTVLWACRHIEDGIIDYVNELNYYLLNSEPEPMVNDSPQLTPMAAMYIVGFCGSNVQSRYGKNDRTLFDLWDVIRFVEFIMLAESTTFDSMKQMLASWLLEDYKSPERLLLWTDGDRDGLISQAEVSWTRKQASAG
jgi:hypothetical protein